MFADQARNAHNSEIPSIRDIYPLWRVLTIWVLHQNGGGGWFGIRFMFFFGLRRSKREVRGPMRIGGVECREAKSGSLCMAWFGVP